MPDESKGTVGPPAVGSITSDGSYIMSTESAGDGVIVGHHKVGITGVEPVADSDAGGTRSREGRRRLHEGQGQGGLQAQRGGSKKKDEEMFTDKGGKKYRYVVPMKFSRPDESGIIVKVDGAQTINFDIDESGKVTTNR